MRQRNPRWWFWCRRSLEAGLSMGVLGLFCTLFGAAEQTPVEHRPYWVIGAVVFFCLAAGGVASAFWVWWSHRSED